MLWLELLRCSGVLRNLPVPVAGAQGWVDGQMMLATVLLNVVGHDRVSDVDALEEDHSLCRLMRKYEPEILGIPAKALSARFRGGRERTFPSANAVHDWLGRFQDAATRELGKAMVPEPATELPLMECVSLALGGLPDPDAGAGGADAGP